MRNALLILGIAAVVFALAFPAITTRTECGPKSEVAIWSSQIQAACLGYKTEYGKFPPSENRQLVPLLLGNNPRKIPFIEFPPKYLSKDGEVLDPWGTPFHITYRANDLVVIESAGSDALFGTKDDFTTLK